MLFLFSLRARLQRGRNDSPESDAHDGLLIAQATRGNVDAFNTLIARHQAVIYSVAMRYMRHAPAAEDVVQDSVLRAWNALDTFRNDGSVGFRTWMLRITTNRALDVLRSEQRRPTDSLDQRLDDPERADDLAGEEESPHDFAERTELSAYLERALTQLPDEQRLAIILSDVQHLSYPEIAEITGVAVGTVKSRLNRGRLRLREILLADPAGRELLGRRERLLSDTPEEGGRQ